MIIAEQKPVEEIKSLIHEHGTILVLGCGTCVTVCNAGGEREVSVLSSVLRLSDQSGQIKEATIERQCDEEFFTPEIKAEAEECDAVLSMACGVGVQLAARVFAQKFVYPALNTRFMGINEGAGEWSEACLACGDCKLGRFGGVCPVTQCAKSLCNGPCGGSEDGRCEVDPENLECGWQKIFDRLKVLGKLEVLEENEPPRDWARSHDGGPRKLVREDLVL